jgi:FtsZ-interacting cell division protein ZipA
VLQQPGVNTIAASHLLRLLLLLLLLLLLSMCKTGLWKERNSSDKNVTHHPKKMQREMQVETQEEEEENKEERRKSKHTKENKETKSDVVYGKTLNS